MSRASFIERGIMLPTPANRPEQTMHEDEGNGGRHGRVRRGYRGILENENMKQRTTLYRRF
jgi:hypothetical protein